MCGTLKFKTCCLKKAKDYGFISVHCVTESLPKRQFQTEEQAYDMQTCRAPKQNTPVMEPERMVLKLSLMLQMNVNC
jgi:hypothetical protein